MRLVFLTFQGHILESDTVKMFKADLLLTINKKALELPAHFHKLKDENINLFSLLAKKI